MNESPHKPPHHRCGPPGFIRRYWQRRKARRLDKLAAKLQLSSRQRTALDDIISSIENGRQLLMRQGTSVLSDLSAVLRDPDDAAIGEADPIFAPIQEQYLQLSRKVAAFSRQLSAEQRQALEVLLNRGLHRCGRLTCRA